MAQPPHVSPSPTPFTSPAPALYPAPASERSAVHHSYNPTTEASVSLSWGPGLVWDPAPIRHSSQPGDNRDNSVTSMTNYNLPPFGASPSLHL